MKHLVKGAFLLCKEDLSLSCLELFDNTWEEKSYKASLFETAAMNAYHMENHIEELLCAAAAWACKGIRASRCDDRAMQCVIELLEIKKQI